MTKKLVWALVALTLLCVFALAWAPFIIKVKAERDHPGIRVGDVTLRWGYVAFTQVGVDREGIKGKLDRVTVDWDRNVRIVGGTLHVDLDAKKSSKGEGTSKGRITGEGLTVDVVKGSNLKADLKEVSFDDEQVCFTKGLVVYDGHSVDALKGCASRDGQTFRGDRVETVFSLPFDIPRVERSQKVSVTGITANLHDKSLKFKSADAGPLKIKGPSEVRMFGDDVVVTLDTVEVNHPWVDPETVTVKRLGFRLPKTLAQGKGVIKVTIGPATVTIEPNINHIQGEQTCNEWIEAMPEPLPEALQQARGHFKGSFAFEVVTDPTPRMKLHNDCRFECSHDPIATLRKPKFTYQAYDSKNELFARTVGPGTKDWVNIEELPPSVPKAFITLEDPGFLSHRGIIPQALENSLKDNLKLGRFFRGGSTITMQLAKNLWLRRHKTIGRKVQEAMLTLALESCLSKSQILEMYTNVVEFGPNLYGIGPATHRYFSKPAEGLETDEAFYLASILPHPRNAIPPESGGLKRVRSLMQILADRGFISEEMVPIQDGVVDSTGWDTE